MITHNLANKIRIIFETSDQVSGRTYVLKNTLTNNIYRGQIESNQITIELEDGLYCITIYNEDREDFKSTFNVYYNYLPNFVKDIQKLTCGCNNCGDKKDTDIYQTYQLSLNYFSATGLLCNLKAYNYYTQIAHKNVMEAQEYKKYYGKFVFNYEENIRNLLISTYIELYLRSSNITSNNQKDLDELNQLFKISSIEKCLYKIGYDFCKISNLIESLTSDCNCNE